MDQISGDFKGWAMVEIMGHNTVSGFVETVAFGSTVMFRVSAPEVAEVEQVLECNQYIDHRMVPAGSIVKVSRPEVEILVGAASVYRMTRCLEERALSAVPQKIEVVKLAEAVNGGPSKADILLLTTTNEDEEDYV